VCSGGDAARDLNLGGVGGRLAGWDDRVYSRYQEDEQKEQQEEGTHDGSSSSNKKH
jgi:hypothetical protein